MITHIIVANIPLFKSSSSADLGQTVVFGVSIMTQNLNKVSPWTQRALAGDKITWILPPKGGAWGQIVYGSSNPTSSDVGRNGVLMRKCRAIDDSMIPSE